MSRRIFCEWRISEDSRLQYFSPCDLINAVNYNFIFSMEMQERRASWCWEINRNFLTINERVLSRVALTTLTEMRPTRIYCSFSQLWQLISAIIRERRSTKASSFVSRRRNKFVWHFPSISSISSRATSFSERGIALEQVQRFLRNADWKLLARPTERFKIREKHRVKSIEVVWCPERGRMV